MRDLSLAFSLAKTSGITLVDHALADFFYALWIRNSSGDTLRAREPDASLDGAGGVDSFTLTINSLIPISPLFDASAFDNSPGEALYFKADRSWVSLF